MIVNQFNTFPYGGAAAAARRLHEQLNRSGPGVESRFFYHRDEKETKLDSSYHHLTFEQAAHRPSLFSPVRKQLEKRRVRNIYRLYDEHLAGHDSGGEVFSMAELPEKTPVNWKEMVADIVHLHWVSFFIDYPSFFASLPSEVPVVWTLHDMNAFTGGCHYSNGCARYEIGCGHCSQIKNANDHDVSRQSFRQKLKTLRNREVHVVTPSLWLCDLAQRSPVWPDGTSFHVINYGLDLKELYPLDKQAARKELGIESNAVLIGFGAEDITNQRKGFQHLLESLKRLPADAPVECLVFGAGVIEDDLELPKMHHFGYVDSVEKQRLIYSAADLVVVPSREDNQPQVGLEAMACGTPLVGFAAGGIPEYIRPGITGYLAKLGDESDLAHQIVRLVDDTPARQAMGARARLLMEHDFEASAQTDKYIDLYRSTLFMKDFRRSAA